MRCLDWQGKGLDSSIGVLGTLPQANLVAGGVCEGGVVVVCAGHITCAMSSPETGIIASHRVEIHPRVRGRSGAVAVDI